MKAVRGAFVFGGYTLDLSRCLPAADRPTPRRPESFALLAYLVQNPDRPVPEDQ